jgi:hypothetical protein
MFSFDNSISKSFSLIASFILIILFLDNSTFHFVPLYFTILLSVGNNNFDFNKILGKIDLILINSHS